MERRIFGIGSGRYYFDRKTLNSFVEEARKQASVPGPPEAGLTDAASAGELDYQEVKCIFEEVMSLYHDYMRCQNVDLLVRLKCRLESFSVRYKSHVLAEEVLNINSCLPYERRIRLPGE